MPWDASQGSKVDEKNGLWALLLEMPRDAVKECINRKLRLESALVDEALITASNEDSISTARQEELTGIFQDLVEHRWGKGDNVKLTDETLLKLKGKEPGLNLDSIAGKKHSDMLASRGTERFSNVSPKP